ncbi:MAG TPA: NusG domain II-containing protein [Candidatus Anaerobutyricum avicola]|nr:NusG domain II-containing protein [Candidatus Anaerobutyricum avicola]
MRKADVILISAFLLIGLAGLLLFAAWRDEGEFVRVTVDGTVFGEYPLDRDDVIDIETGEGTNTLTIVDGQADMTEADCPDKICVDHIAISRAGESIVCLPHRIVVEIIAGEGREDQDTGYDGITR